MEYPNIIFHPGSVGDPWVEIVLSNTCIVAGLLDGICSAYSNTDYDLAIHGDGGMGIYTRYTGTQAHVSIKYPGHSTEVVCDLTRWNRIIPHWYCTLYGHSVKI